MTATLSVVIVNYRSWDDLDACLKSLEPLEAEIIVVDNDSADGLMDRFCGRHPRVRFIRNEGNYGYAHGCNRGANVASGEWLLFMNPDARDPGGQIRALLQAATSCPDAGIVAPGQVDEHGRPRKIFDAFPSALTLLGPVRSLLRAIAPARYPDPHDTLAEWAEVDWVSGSVLLLRHDLWSELGGWHEGFWMYSEDVDLCRRARDRGAKVHATARATIVHRHGGASRRDPAIEALTRAETTISRHYYAHRHFRVLHAGLYHLMLAVFRFLPVAAAGLLSLVVPLRGLRRRGRTALLILAYYRQILVHRRWRSPRAVG